MSSGLFKKMLPKPIRLQVLRVCVCERDLALIYLLGLICHETQSTQPIQNWRLIIRYRSYLEHSLGVAYPSAETQSAKLKIESIKGKG